MPNNDTANGVLEEKLNTARPGPLYYMDDESYQDTEMPDSDDLPQTADLAEYEAEDSAYDSMCGVEYSNSSDEAASEVASENNEEQAGIPSSPPAVRPSPQITTVMGASTVGHTVPPHLIDPALVSSSVATPPSAPGSPQAGTPSQVTLPPNASGSKAGSRPSALTITRHDSGNDNSSNGGIHPYPSPAFPRDTTATPASMRTLSPITEQPKEEEEADMNTHTQQDPLAALPPTVTLTRGSGSGSHSSSSSTPRSSSIRLVPTPSAPSHLSPDQHPTLYRMLTQRAQRHRAAEQEALRRRWQRHFAMLDRRAATLDWSRDGARRWVLVWNEWELARQRAAGEESG